jgi:hypothetical protein
MGPEWVRGTSGYPSLMSSTYYFVVDHELIMSSQSILDDVEPKMDYGILVCLV